MYISIKKVIYISMIDGLLLKPTHPALSLESTFVQRAFGSEGPNGHIAAAYSEVNYHNVMCRHINQFQ